MTGRILSECSGIVSNFEHGHKIMAFESMERCRGKFREVCEKCALAPAACSRATVLIHGRAFIARLK